MMHNVSLCSNICLTTRNILSNIKLIEHVKSFIIKNNLIIHNETAIRYYTTQNKRMIDCDESGNILPFNVYTFDAEYQAFNMFYELKSKNHSLIQVVKSLLDNNTYHVSYELKELVILNQISKKDFDLLHKTCVSYNGSLIANINFVKAKAYIEIAIPTSYLFRWKELYPKLEVLETMYSITDSYDRNQIECDVDELPISIIQIVKNIYEFLIQHNYPFVGNQALRYYLNLTRNVTKNIMKNSPFRYIQVLSDNVEETIKGVISNILCKHKNIEYKIYDNMTPTSSLFLLGKMSIDVTVYNHTYRILSVFDTSKECISVVNDKTNNDVSIRYGSIFFLLYMYYFYLFEYASTNKSNVYKTIQLYTRLLIETIQESHFSLKHYGNDETFITRILQLKSRTNKSIIIKSS